MVSSENFGKLIGRLVAKNKGKLITFMRSEGISIGTSASNEQVIEALFSAMKSTKFRDDFVAHLQDTSEESSNMQGSESSANGGFDPMATQSGGFTTRDTQDGANLKGDGFSNANARRRSRLTSSNDTFEVNGVRYTQAEWNAYKKQRGKRQLSANGEFDPMATQSGGFTTRDTQNGANLKGDTFSNAGGFWDGFNAGSITDLIVGASGVYGADQVNKTQRAIANATLEAKRLDLELQKEQGKLTTEQYKQQLALATLGKNAPKSTVTLWIVGGVVLLGALGTTIYFATRKK